MERRLFERLVRKALDTIPEDIAAHMDNVDVVVEDWPTQSQLAVNEIHDGEYLLGLYEGVPLTSRHEYGNVLPDKITIFQRSIEAVCQTNDEVVMEVRNTVVHEIAHHFGIDDDRLDELGV
ncbi:MAG: metallopeptidase family protein [SAR202 cluster bacterium]|nr:metallopeptidase family protein [SAR202 cluster bacterium]